MAIQNLYNEYMQIPPITRGYTTACIVTTALVESQWINPYQLYFNPHLIFRKFQIWRLFTNFCYMGNIGFNFFFQILFMFRYCRYLEEGSFRGRTADFFFLCLFGTVMITLFACFYNVFFLYNAFTIMLVYIWGRRNPQIRMNFMGLFNFRAINLHWALLAVSFILGNQFIIDVVGIAAGHLYYFLEDVFPYQDDGFRILKTPNILHRLFDQLDQNANQNEQIHPIIEEELNDETYRNMTNGGDNNNERTENVDDGNNNGNNDDNENRNRIIRPGGYNWN
ncbi:hypothetical protein SNEBB_005364 [Seison nebaliae]|nr:hypothetical protein SNEBB_005364 [Seison nebaliae]